VIEVNDNPNIDVGSEDAVVRDEMYNRIMEIFPTGSNAARREWSSHERTPLHLFEAFGVEIEYMIVDARTLDVRPITDRVFEAVAGQIVSDVEVGEITWSERADGPCDRAEDDRAGAFAGRASRRIQ